MKIAFCSAMLIVGLAATVAVSRGADDPKDPPADPPKRAPKDAPDNSAAVEKFVDRMMSFNKKKDGKLTKDEITDERLQRVFDRADANHDGVVTKEELVELAKKMAPSNSGEGRRGPGGFGDNQGTPAGGPPGDGPDGDRPRFGPGRGGPPRPGQILSGGLQDRLKLTTEQKSQLAELQKDVDAKLAKILTDEQKKQLEEIGRRGPGGNGPPGGPPDENGPPRDQNGPRRGPGGDDKPDGF